MSLVSLGLISFPTKSRGKTVLGKSFSAARSMSRTTAAFGFILRARVPCSHEVGLEAYPT